MARNAEGENSQRGNAGSSTTTTARIRARAKPLLLICQCFGFITSVAAFLCIAVNVISATRSFKNGPYVFDGIFRCYAVVIAILVVVAETEWGSVMKFWKVLEYWTGRGMLQIFVAVMTRAYPEDSEEQKELILLQNIASYMLLACGVVYVISELERRREELEALLIVQPD
ncbi:uncharacterized protein LOC130780952 isoform X2 [Actinidia eriantha]|uniref:uncharacterized protein LOC130780952 isoform X2 n=1 Tax=Actinidia eriantha TaxID=165200 RepID=UPI00258B2E99|nr:uncharacterized protein LOC130780952 isoform X2 [Actinidia eriantha]